MPLLALFFVGAGWADSTLGPAEAPTIVVKRAQPVRLATASDRLRDARTAAFERAYPLP